jgi:hypothetical protein
MRRRLAWPGPTENNIYRVFWSKRTGSYAVIAAHKGSKGGLCGKRLVLHRRSRHENHKEEPMESPKKCPNVDRLLSLANIRKSLALRPAPCRNRTNNPVIKSVRLRGFSMIRHEPL